MNERQKYICDRVMDAITNADGQTKFGISGITSIPDGKATDKEVAEAVHFLIENEYLKMLGAYVFGIGVRDDLKDYDLSDFDPFAKMPGDAEKSTAGTFSLRNQQAYTVPKYSDTDELTTDDTADSSAANDAIEVPTFTPPSQSQNDPVQAAVKALQNALKPTTVSNISIKCQVLQQLSTVLAPVDPFFGSVLDDIRTDYEQRLTALQHD